MTGKRLTWYECFVSAGQCAVCGREIAGHGYPAEPIAKGLCCDECLVEVAEAACNQQWLDIQAEKEFRNSGPWDETPLGVWGASKESSP
jgi:hypothetical protein